MIAWESSCYTDQCLKKRSYFFIDP